MPLGGPVVNPHQNPFGGAGGRPAGGEGGKFWVPGKVGNKNVHGRNAVVNSPRFLFADKFKLLINGGKKIARVLWTPAKKSRWNLKNHLSKG